MKNKLTIGFDIDDTILIPGIVTESGREAPNYEVIAVYRFFQEQGHHMVLWSGSGVDWATTWGEKFNLNPDEVRRKGEGHVDICFDDCDVEIATVNVKVKRYHNGVSREEWNRDKRM